MYDLAKINYSSADYAPLFTSELWIDAPGHVFAAAAVTWRDAALRFNDNRVTAGETGMRPDS